MVPSRDNVCDALDAHLTVTCKQFGIIWNSNVCMIFMTTVCIHELMMLQLLPRPSALRTNNVTHS